VTPPMERRKDVPPSGVAVVSLAAPVPEAATPTDCHRQFNWRDSEVPMSSPDRPEPYAWINTEQTVSGLLLTSGGRIHRGLAQSFMASA
jgi:hypothetical protein